MAVAKILQKLFVDKKFDIAFLGKQSIDDDFNQTGQLLAALMGLPCGSFCSKIEIKEGNKVAEVQREVDSGLQKI